MNIYVVRHGRTDNNDKSVFNGRYDEDINETGINQAKILKEEVKDMNIDLIICSPMKRTRHTAEILNVNSLPIIYDDRLIERDTGELTLKPHKTVDREEYWNYYSNKYINLETVPELFKRVHPVIDDIKEKYNGKNVLVVTHGGVARAVYAYFNGIPEDGKILHVGQQENCEIKKYETK